MDLGIDNTKSGIRPFHLRKNAKSRVITGRTTTISTAIYKPLASK